MPEPMRQQNYATPEGNLDGLFGHEPLVICRLKAKWSRILQDERKKQVLLSLWRSPHRKSFADLARDVGTNRKQIRRWIYGDRRHRTVFDYLINYPEPRQGKPAEIGLTGLGKRFALWLEAGHTPTEEELEELAWIVLRYYYRTGKSPRAVAARQNARHQRGSNQPSNCSHTVATLYPHCGHTVATSVSVSVSETKDLNKSGNSVTENGNERGNDMPVRGRNERQGNDLWLGLDGLGTELAHKRASDLTRLGDLLPYKPAPPRPDPAPPKAETKPPETDKPTPDSAEIAQQARTDQQTPTARNETDHAESQTEPNADQPTDQPTDQTDNAPIAKANPTSRPAEQDSAETGRTDRTQAARTASPNGRNAAPQHSDGKVRCPNCGMLAADLGGRFYCPRCELHFYPKTTHTDQATPINHQSGILCPQCHRIMINFNGLAYCPKCEIAITQPARLRPAPTRRHNNGKAYCPNCRMQLAEIDGRYYCPMCRTYLNAE